MLPAGATAWRHRLPAALTAAWQQAPPGTPRTREARDKAPLWRALMRTGETMGRSSTSAQPREIGSRHERPSRPAKSPPSPQLRRACGRPARRPQSHGLLPRRHGTGVMDAEVVIEPDPVRKSEPVTITISTLEGESQDWSMRIVAAHDPTAVMRAPRGLDAYGAPRAGDPDVYDCKIRTIGFEPGEYLVDLAPKGKFDSQGMVSKKFTVEP